jgi:glycogen synthase
LREVWRDAALYVAPEDPAALRDCLQRLIADEALRKEFAARARRRARRYTPERMAVGYLAAYAAVMNPLSRAACTRPLNPQTELRACAS